LSKTVARFEYAPEEAKHQSKEKKQSDLSAHLKSPPEFGRTNAFSRIIAHTLIGRFEKRLEFLYQSKLATPPKRFHLIKGVSESLAGGLAVVHLPGLSTSNP